MVKDFIELENGWCEGTPPSEGVYLRASDEWDDDEDGDEFWFINHRWNKEGSVWICYGGVWKRIGDLQPGAELID